MMRCLFRCIMSRFFFPPNVVPSVHGDFVNEPVPIVRFCESFVKFVLGFNSEIQGQRPK